MIICFVAITENWDLESGVVSHGHTSGNDWTWVL